MDHRMTQLARVHAAALGAALLFLACGDTSEPGSSAPASGGGGDGTATGGGASGSSPAGSGGVASVTGSPDASASGGSGGDGGSSGAPPVDAAREAGNLGKSPFDWVGIIGSGQSLSTGCCEGVALSASQPYKNLKLADTGPDPKYPIDDSGMPMWSAVPLIEPIRTWVPGYGTCMYPPDNCQYPNNIFKNGETPHSGMANMLSSIWRARGSDYITAHTVIGVGGSLLQYIAKGTGSYKAALHEAKVFTQLAKTAGKTYGVAAIVLTHGEADAGNADYEAGVYQYLQDLNTDLKAITGQTRDVVLIASQQSSQATKGDSSAVQIWRAGIDHPGQMVCAGPKYDYTYPDGLHMTSAGYLRLGEKYAEIYDQVVNQGIAWKPLGPTKVTRAGAVITIDFDVPNPPLNWDENLVAPHQVGHTAWSKGRGFEVSDAGGNDVAIASSEIRGASVVLTLTQAPPAGTALKVSYATTQDFDNNLYGTAALHGQLRDSDELVGYDAEKIEVQVTSGSAQIKAAAGAFMRRAGRDVVEGSGLAAGTVVYTVSADTIMLSAPWTGASGMAELSFHHDLHNYCVHFSMMAQ
jgi:hypothetical protein